MMALRKTLTTMIRRIMIDGDMGTTQHGQRMFLDDLDNHESDSLSDKVSEKENVDVQQDRSYHVGVMFMADEREAFFGKCYNCGEPGHPWRECKKPMKPALRMALKAENERRAALAEKKGLNQTRGCWSEGRPHPQDSPGQSRSQPEHSLQLLERGRP